MRKTKEQQYNISLELAEKHGIASLGILTNQTWVNDPKRMVFALSRYKFVAKMLSGFDKVLEVGCADGFGSRIVKQEIKELDALDFDPIFISNAQEGNIHKKWQINFFVHDILEGPTLNKYNAIYSLDVLEHIPPEKEHLYFENICQSMQGSESVLIIGSPSLESQKHASLGSKLGHVNCKNGEDLKKICNHYFKNVFLFSMNDEVVHTGFQKMAHYFLIICCNKKYKYNLRDSTHM